MNFVNLLVSVGINDFVIILCWVVFVEVFIVIGMVGLDGLWICRGCSEVQFLLVVDDCCWIVIDVVLCIVCLFVVGFVSFDNVFRDMRNNISGCSYFVIGYSSDLYNVKVIMQVFLLYVCIIIVGFFLVVLCYIFSV